MQDQSPSTNEDVVTFACAAVIAAAGFFVGELY